MSECVFCKIVEGEIPSVTVYEDENFKAIMDIAPASNGHVIIVAKKHAANVFELSEEMASKVYVVAKKIATVIKEEFKCDGVNILQNNGEAAGQTVFHFHMHIIPRYNNDSINIKWDNKPANMDEVKKIAERIKSHLK